MCAKQARKDPGQKARRPAVPKRKRTFVLTVDSSSRIDAHALGMGVDVSDVVEQLVQRHLRRFVLHDRGGYASDGPETEGQGGGGVAA